MKVVFQTNLDLAKPSVAGLNSSGLGFLGTIIDSLQSTPPAVGSRIRFTKNKLDQRYFELEVCMVTYDLATGAVLVELHMPSYYATKSIAEWEAWFKEHWA